jgi:hypothetical protein
MKYPCPVCGYRMDDLPQDYNICPSCGTEFGYHDAGRTYEELRQAWLKLGADWWSTVDEKPRGWNPYIQLFEAGLAYDIGATATNATATIGPKTQDIVTELSPFQSYEIQTNIAA